MAEERDHPSAPAPTARSRSRSCKAPCRRRPHRRDIFVTQNETNIARRRAPASPADMGLSVAYGCGTFRCRRPPVRCLPYARSSGLLNAVEAEQLRDGDGAGPSDLARPGRHRYPGRAGLRLGPGPGHPCTLSDPGDAPWIRPGRDDTFTGYLLGGLDLGPADGNQAIGQAGPRRRPHGHAQGDGPTLIPDLAWRLQGSSGRISGALPPPAKATGFRVTPGDICRPEKLWGGALSGRVSGAGFQDRSWPGAPSGRPGPELPRASGGRRPFHSLHRHVGMPRTPDRTEGGCDPPCRRGRQGQRTGLAIRSRRGPKGGGQPRPATILRHHRQHGHRAWAAVLRQAV